MSKKWSPILSVLLIIAAFAIGSMWTKIQFLQSGQPAGGSGAVVNTQQPAAVANVPKTDKPNVELFVMSYCPFGLQTQKAMVSAVELLGNKINFQPRWVSYAMHGQKEVEENLRQFCIAKEQPEKYLSYLRCFVTANDTADCQNKAGLDMAKLNTCFTGSDNQFGIMKAFNDKASWISGQYPKFAIDEPLNTKYSVRGSPTLVINGVTVNAARSANELKSLICSAFKNPPGECQKNLTTSQEAPGAGAIGLAYNPPAGGGTGGCQ
ncbi:hypothetical protein A2872_03375 [Candidatus Gottesmanbacteria bacterium RIFCSPHIGHO2_01_FULL_42_12]|uniref:Thioredoxin-like fold domain-containing protein n=1 Tax=Candidatus Gottesmanbacteria bacterium RIFCSPHIGHO2_01_FULL_42_12 TaxID=1798377 RepID=A0A1F5Z491_9BACT|nr:MAG: hypothetical protein A2872_03375 [Candidatus Gottesmanbacteria bacterium RIFCSPHIGHO2_01_FULL_42_12]